MWIFWFFWCWFVGHRHPEHDPKSRVVLFIWGPESGPPPSRTCIRCHTPFFISRYRNV